MLFDEEEPVKDKKTKAAKEDKEGGKEEEGGEEGLETEE